MLASGDQSRLKKKPFLAPSPKSADELKRARSTDKKYTNMRNNEVSAKKKALRAMLASGDQKSAQKGAYCCSGAEVH